MNPENLKTKFRLVPGEPEPTSSDFYPEKMNNQFSFVPKEHVYNQGRFVPGEPEQLQFRFVPR